MVKPFDYVKDINYGKKNIMVDDVAEKDYNAFIVNRALSYFNDTVLYANEMNIHHSLDSKLQYSFLINIVRKRKRFSKWIKSDLENNIEKVKEYYGYSMDKARQVMPLLSTDQLNIIINKVDKGGRK